ncbi:MAG: NAD(P)H-dependent oxidoreductase [Odoribacteraceae bacterium]|nr:NAD(P)H-dependent oxidoreductase [Odoribacteraceae bacterium]
MKNLLFVNACVNRGTSRTYRLARELVALLEGSDDFDTREVTLEEEGLQPLTSVTLNRRAALAADGVFSDPVFRHARQAREADVIVMAAPYWDMGFPALLKVYIEAVSIPGIVYRYGEKGPTGLCRATKLYYVTTRGGFIDDARDLGFATVTELGKLYGIKEVKCISLNGLDIPADNLESVIRGVIAGLPARL